MTTVPRKIIRYSISFKQKIVREIEQEGKGIEEIRRQYGIKGGATVQNWLKQLGKNHLLNKIVRVEMRGEKDRIKEMEAEIKKLKIALADATLEKHAMETIIEIVNEHYGTDVKKNLGQQPLQNLVSKKDAG